MKKSIAREIDLDQICALDHMETGEKAIQVADGEMMSPDDALVYATAILSAVVATRCRRCCALIATPAPNPCPTHTYIDEISAAIERVVAEEVAKAEDPQRHN